MSAEAVLIPYVRVPTLLPRMILETFEAHWTTAYFHLDQDNPYVRTKPGEGPFNTAMASLDNAVSCLAVGPLAVFVLLGSMALVAVRGRRRRSRTAAVAALLLAVIGSQLVVCLLGEGFRDLSKHLMLGLFALELLSVVLLGAVLAKRPE